MPADRHDRAPADVGEDPRAVPLGLGAPLGLVARHGAGRGGEHGLDQRQVPPETTVHPRAATEAASSAAT